MIRVIEKFMLLAVLACMLPACKGHQTTGPLPAGTLLINGTSVNGSVETGSIRIYTLSGITQNNTYRVRTTIAPGGTLIASVYSDFLAYKEGSGPIATSEAIVPDYYEVSFTAAQNSDHVVVLSGIPSNANYSSLYFYGLRLMSATGTPQSSALSSFSTFTVDPVTGQTATAVGTIYPDTLAVYSGETITFPPGTYSILLTSSTLTLSYPQMFIYRDNSLSLGSLMFSIVTATTGSEFSISDFSTNPTISTFPSTAPTVSSFSRLSAVSFPTTSGGPFILVKGVSQATYTLQVGP